MIMYIPFSVAITPITGHAYVNHWWVVHPTEGLMFFLREGALRSGSGLEPTAQCNLDSRVAWRHAGNFDGCIAQFIPVVYAGHAIIEANSLHIQHRVAKVLSAD